MRIVLAVLLVTHGLIHLMGLLKAFRFAELPQLTIPISKPLGVVWLVATLALLGAAASLHNPRRTLLRRLGRARQLHF